jgi:hypothetical protein
VTAGIGPLASTVADDDDTAWYLDRQQRMLAGLLDGTTAGCTHVRSAGAIWAFAVDMTAYCPACWPTQLSMPLADRHCDLCGTRQAACWTTIVSPGEPLTLVAAVCDPCETSRVLDLPRPTRDDGR